MSVNSIALADKCLPLLDRVYKQTSKTAILDVADALVQFDGANTVKYFEMAMDGLGDYDRANGFVKGGVQGVWKSWALTHDRGRSFSVDNMDNEETLGLTFGNLAGEFIRTKVVPEVDAIRFATYASTSNISAANADITPGTTDVPALIDTAESQMNDDEVPEEGRILFVSENAYKGLKAKITRILANENGVQRNIEVFDNMPVIRVPKNRFNTAITLYDGKTAGQTDGGYIVPASTSYAINFMIVHPSAVRQITKHVKPRIFSPDVNQDADAWKFDYRIYHDAKVFENKVKGIYLHRAATANS